MADAWKIGRREVGDGLLLVVARDDRRVRIEVAKALEGAVPDLAARQIIDRDIAPAFKRGDYAGGLNAAIDSLMARVRGEGLPQPKGRAAPGDSFGGFGLPELGLFFFIAVPVFGALLTRVMGRKLGARCRRRRWSGSKRAWPRVNCSTVAKSVSASKPDCRCPICGEA